MIVFLRSLNVTEILLIILLISSLYINLQLYILATKYKSQLDDLTKKVSKTKKVLLRLAKGI